MQNKIKTKFKISIDILMLIAFLITLTSLAIPNKIVHEIFGFLTIPLVIAHLTLNFNWIKGITKNLFKGKLKKKIVFQYILFILLMAVFIVVIITGILTSTFIANADIGNTAHRSHTVPSIIFIVFCIIHVIMHFHYIKSLFKKVCL